MGVCCICLPGILSCSSGDDSTFLGIAPWHPEPSSCPHQGMGILNKVIQSRAFLMGPKLESSPLCGFVPEGQFISSRFKDPWDHFPNLVAHFFLWFCEISHFFPRHSPCLALNLILLKLARVAFGFYKKLIQKPCQRWGRKISLFTSDHAVCSTKLVLYAGRAGGQNEG